VQKLAIKNQNFGSIAVYSLTFKFKFNFVPVKIFYFLESVDRFLYYTESDSKIGNRQGSCLQNSIRSQIRPFSAGFEFDSQSEFCNYLFKEEFFNYFYEIAILSCKLTRFKKSKVREMEFPGVSLGAV